MAQKQNGFILVIALIFLQVVAILGVYALQDFAFTAKMTRFDGIQHQLFLASEQILREIEGEWMQSPSNCRIPITEQSELLTKPLTWWQSSAACIGNDLLFQYYYVVERLSLDYCAEIGYSPGVVAYFRITLLVFDPVNQSKEWLQSIIATLDSAEGNCTGSRHAVLLGRQMWRELR